MSAPTVSRRDFLASTALAGSGLVVPAFVPAGGRRDVAQQAAPFAPNAFVRIATDAS